VGLIYAAVFDGLKLDIYDVPTVCTVGYKYIVGFADFVGICEKPNKNKCLIFDLLNRLGI